MARFHPIVSAASARFRADAAELAMQHTVQRATAAIRLLGEALLNPCVSTSAPAVDVLWQGHCCEGQDEVAESQFSLSTAMPFARSFRCLDYYDDLERSVQRTALRAAVAPSCNKDLHSRTPTP
jgi:hypothetical protein